MAHEEWDTDQSLSISHEVDDEGTYTMTVSDKDTGELRFAWCMDMASAEEMARLILKTGEAYRAAMN